MLFLWGNRGADATQIILNIWELIKKMKKNGSFLKVAIAIFCVIFSCHANQLFGASFEDALKISCLAAELEAPNEDEIQTLAVEIARQAIPQQPKEQGLGNILVTKWTNSKHMILISGLLPEVQYTDSNIGRLKDFINSRNFGSLPRIRYGLHWLVSDDEQFESAKTAITELKDVELGNFSEVYERNKNIYISILEGLIRYIESIGHLATETPKNSPKLKGGSVTNQASNERTYAILHHLSSGAKKGSIPLDDLYAALRLIFFMDDLSKSTKIHVATMTAAGKGSFSDDDWLEMREYIAHAMHTEVQAIHVKLKFRDTLEKVLISSKLPCWSCIRINDPNLWSNGFKGLVAGMTISEFFSCPVNVSFVGKNLSLHLASANSEYQSTSWATEENGHPHNIIRVLEPSTQKQEIEELTKDLGRYQGNLKYERDRNEFNSFINYFLIAAKTERDRAILEASEKRDADVVKIIGDQCRAAISLVNEEKKKYNNAVAGWRTEIYQAIFCNGDADSAMKTFEAKIAEAREAFERALDPKNLSSDKDCATIIGFDKNFFMATLEEEIATARSFCNYIRDVRNAKATYNQAVQAAETTYNPLAKAARDADATLKACNQAVRDATSIAKDTKAGVEGAEAWHDQAVQVAEAEAGQSIEVANARHVQAILLHEDAIAKHDQAVQAAKDGIRRARAVRDAAVQTARTANNTDTAAIAAANQEYNRAIDAANQAEAATIDKLLELQK
ncbi:MAG: hypothetical protein LBF54_04310 [Holosporaceae bacterium]|jgi:hypothetical protein|nr:hypothetical protein [Holosporaceae bacterium]